MPQPRGHQDFFFIEDLGRLGIRNAKTGQFHWDIIVLVLFMGVTFWFSSKIMTQSTPQPPTLDENQKEMQKQMQTLMPIVFLATMAFLPIPAGVFIYFIISNVFQIVQSLLVNKLVKA